MELMVRIQVRNGVGVEVGVGVRWGEDGGDGVDSDRLDSGFELEEELGMSTGSAGLPMHARFASHDIRWLDHHLGTTKEDGVWGLEVVGGNDLEVHLAFPPLVKAMVVNLEIGRLMVAW